MGKKKNPLVLVVLVGILLISFFYFFSLSESGGSGLIVHYYKDGVEVTPINSLSVIQIDTSSYDEISFEIIGENLGDYQINNMQVDSAGPIQLKDSLPTLSKSLSPKETKTLWISDRIDVHQFESLTQPIKFWVNISGESPYIQGKIYDYMELEMEFNRATSCSPPVCPSGYSSISESCADFICSRTCEKIISGGCLWEKNIYGQLQVSWNRVGYSECLTWKGCSSAGNNLWWYLNGPTENSNNCYAYYTGHQLTIYGGSGGGVILYRGTDPGDYYSNRYTPTTESLNSQYGWFASLNTQSNPYIKGRGEGGYTSARAKWVADGVSGYTNTANYLSLYQATIPYTVETITTTTTQCSY